MTLRNLFMCIKQHKIEIAYHMKYLFWIWQDFKILGPKQLQDCVLEKIIILAHILTLWIVRFLAPWQTFFMIVLWGSVKVFQEKADPVSLSISSFQDILVQLKNTW